ncbi:hypothetical protein MKX03_027792, partial [Papaver bracteatum]
VAMEEAASMGARCFFIDQNKDVTSTTLYALSLLDKAHGLIYSISVYFQVTYQKLVNLVKSSDSIWHSFQKVGKVYKQIKKEDYTRSLNQIVHRFWKGVSPES